MNPFKKLLLPNFKAMIEQRDIAGLAKAAKHSDPLIRWEAVWSLGSTMDPRAVGPLTLALEDPDERVRLVAVDELIKIGGEWVFEPLSFALHDHLPSIRKKAARGISIHGGDSAVGLLVPLLDDDDPSVRRAAVEGLGQHPRSNVAIQAMISALSDDDAGVRQAIVSSMNRTDSDLLVAEMNGIVRRDSDRAYTIASEILDGTSREEARRLLLNGLKSEASADRRACIEALVKVGGAQAVAVLATALEQASGDTAGDIIAGLSRIGGELVVPSLTVAAQSSDWDIYVWAREALRRNGSNRAIISIGELLREDENLCSWAADALDKIGDSRAVDQLVITLKGNRTVARRYAAHRLSHIAVQRCRALNAYLTLSDDLVAELRTLDAATELGGLHVTTRLTAMLQGRDKNARVTAVKEYITLTNLRILAALKEVINDPDQHVREIADDTVRRIGEWTAGGPIINWIGDTKWEFRD